MAKRENVLLGLLSDFIRRNPKTSAGIAFNLGVYAGATMKKNLARHDMSVLPDKIAALVPSMKDITDYVPLLDRPATTKKPGPARKATSRRRAKRTSKRRR